MMVCVQRQRLHDVIEKRREVEVGVAHMGSWVAVLSHPERSLSLSALALVQYSGAEKTATIVSGLVQLSYGRAFQELHASRQMTNSTSKVVVREMRSRRSCHDFKSYVIASPMGSRVWKPCSTIEPDLHSRKPRVSNMEIIVECVSNGP